MTETSTIRIVSLAEAKDTSLTPAQTILTGRLVATGVERKAIRKSAALPANQFLEKEELHLETTIRETKDEMIGASTTEARLGISTEVVTAEAVVE